MGKNQLEITVEDRQSLVHLGSLDSFDITEGGKKAAKLILNYLKSGRKSNLKKAIDIYELLIPEENFGGEYTALEWLCKFWTSPVEVQKDMLTVPLINSFYTELSKDDFDNLKTYLEYKYHIKEYKKNVDNTALKVRMRYLEDFILFDNPDRERWENTTANLEKVGLKEGIRVADVGCGPGYYTFKFSDIVGKTGKVYASETNPRHIEFLREYVESNKIENVEVIESSFNGIGLPEDVRVDVVYMCSLYHNVYAAFTDEEREEFVTSIRTALGKNGNRLVIVDNDLVTNNNLPYHGPYINKNLISSQLWYYGFELEDTFQFTPQRYVLVFKMVDIPETSPVGKAVSEDINKIYVDSPASLVRYRIIGTSTSGYTCRGKIGGRLMYEGFMENDNTKLQKAYDHFNDLWPKERIGDDYTAFMWLIKYKMADEKTREEMSKDPFVKDYVDFWTSNDFENFKTYTHYKFDLDLRNEDEGKIDVNYEYSGKDFSIAKLNVWNEYLIFCNPNRDTWEHTNNMLKFFDFKEGETIADIGCGGGFFTWQFSKAVGPTGLVYGTEINDSVLSPLNDFIAKYNVENIKTVVTRMNQTGLEENSVDTIFMCSSYHAVYITNIEYVKDMFIESVRKALKPGGRFIIVDNAVTEKGTPAYYGPGICPELVIAQLSQYGFKLKARFQEIDQRFALIFEMDESFVMPEIKPFAYQMNKGDKKSEAGRLSKVLRPKRRGKRALGDQDMPEAPENDGRSND